MQVQFTIPDFFDISTQNLLVAGTIFLASVLAIAVVSLYKSHYLNKKDVKLAKHWVGVWLAASSAFFTYLGWFVVLASANASFLSGLPYVGKHFLTVMGLAYAIYNIRLTAIYRSLTDGLTKYSKSDDKTITPLDNGVGTRVVASTSDEREFTLPE